MKLSAASLSFRCIVGIHSLYQVVFSFSPGVSGAVWSNITAVPALGACFDCFFE